MKLKNLFSVIAIMALLLFPVLAEANTDAPVEEWTATYGTGGSYSTYAMAVDSQGSTIVTGVFNDRSNPWHGVTVKFSTDGEVEWVRNANNYGYSTDVAVDPDGNVYVAGYYLDIVDPTGPWWKKVVTKYTPDGTEAWTTSHISSAAPAELNYSSTGHLYLIDRVSWGYTSVTRVFQYDAATGERLWGTRAGADYEPTSTVDKDGNVYVTGMTKYVSHKYYMYAETTKIDVNGVVQWNKTYSYLGENDTNWPTDIEVDSLGNTFVSARVGGKYAKTRLWVVKYDPNGNELWSKLPDYDMSASNNRNIYLNIDSEDNAIVSFGNFNLVKFDGTDGDELLYKANRFWPAYGVSDVVMDSDDNIYQTGMKATVKLDKDGNLLWKDSKGYMGYIVLDPKNNIYTSFGQQPANKFLVRKYRQADFDPPVITIATPTGGDYLISESIFVDFTVTDEDSGVESYSAEIDGVEVDSGYSVDLYEFGPGVHTLTVTAVDNEGNSATATVSFNVVVTSDALIDLIWLLYDLGEIDNKGVATSLAGKIENGAMGAFSNYLDAQDGKHISGDAAGILRAAVLAL